MNVKIKTLNKRRLLYIAVLLSCFCSNSFSQDDSVFYFYRGGKIFLQKRSDIIHLHISSGYDSVGRIININHLQLCNFSSEHDLFLKNETEGQPVSRQVFNKFKNLEFVDDISFLLTYNEALQYTTKEFVVKLSDSSSIDEFERLMAKYRCIVKENSTLVNNLFLLANQNDSIETLEMANLFYESGLFEYAEPNFVIINAFHSADTYYDNQWGLKNTGQYGGIVGTDIKIENAWMLTQGDQNIKTAVIDMGVELNHPDLFANLVTGYDASGYNSYGAPVWVGDNHGTCCAGIIAAKANNNLGISGVAPNSKIVPIHTSNDMGYINIYGAINSIQWAMQNGFEVPLGTTLYLITCSCEGDEQ